VPYVRSSRVIPFIARVQQEVSPKSVKGKELMLEEEPEPMTKAQNYKDTHGERPPAYFRDLKDHSCKKEQQPLPE